MVTPSGPDKYNDVLYNFLFRPQLMELFPAPNARQMDWMLDELSSLVFLSRQWTVTDRLKQVPGFKSSRGIFVFTATERRYSKNVFLLGRAIDGKQWLIADFYDDGMGLGDSIKYSSPELMSSKDLVTELVENGIHLLGFFEAVLSELIGTHDDVIRKYEERLSTVKETFESLKRVRESAALIAPNPHLAVPRRKPAS